MSTQINANQHIKLNLSSEACSAVSDALLFMLNLKDFSFENEKISENSASEAEDKLFYKLSTLTRGELRAATKAVDITLLRFPDHESDYAFMTEDYPDILSRLENQLPLLREIQPRLHVEARKLRKKK